MAGENDGPEGDVNFSGLDDLIDDAFDGPGGDSDADDSDGDDDATEDIVTVDPDEETDDDDSDEDDDDEEDEEDLEDEDSDEDEDEEDEDSDEDEEEDDDDDEEEEDEEEEDEEETLSVTAKELKAIRADPVLNRIHKSLTKDYQSKTQELAEKTRELEPRERELNEFQERVGTPEGMAAYLSQTMGTHPEVVGLAFQTIATGDRAQDFLVAIGEGDPETFETAYERVQEILGDEDERKRYIKERDLRSKEASVEAREERMKRRTFDRALSNLEGVAEKEARRLGVEDDDMEEVTKRLRSQIRGKVRDDGSITLRSQDAKSIAKEAKAEIDRLLDKVTKKLNRRKTKESREATKKKARQGKKRRSPPQGAKRKTPKGKNRKFKPEEGRDGLDSFIDHRLGNLD